MNWLTLQRRSDDSARIDLRGVTPDRLRDQSAEAIAETMIRVDDRPSRLGEQFDVVDGRRGGLILRGSVERCDHVGGGMREGELVVQGSVGDFLASGMRGGRMRVDGGAGQYACGDLRGGVVEIRGPVGDHAAAAYRDAQRGMSGGTLVIHGDCGRWLGARMRRGMVVALGSVGAGCATRMIAGTLALAGSVDPP